MKNTLDPYANVVMVSSDTSQEVIVDLKKAGAKGFLVKPIDRNKLYQQVTKADTAVKRA